MIFVKKEIQKCHCNVKTREIHIHCCSFPISFIELEAVVVVLVGKLEYMYIPVI